MFKKVPISIIFLILVGLLTTVYFFIQIHTPASIESQDKVFVIQKGQGVNEISQNLKKANFIKNKFIFETYVFLKKIEKKFQAGEYKLNSNMSMNQIAKILTQGIGVQNEREIKIIEGWTIGEIEEYLEKLRVTGYGLRVTKDDFLKTTIDKSLMVDLVDKYNFLKEATSYKLSRTRDPATTGQATSYLEGFLFPDTYRIYKNATPEDIIKKMLDNFDQKLTPEMRQEIKKQNKTIFEIVIMASIIEKEVPLDKDRSIVSGIFWKRLESGMPLQADSTLNYFTGHKSRALDAEELKIDSFYNTYLYPDLPPTPICNPGLSALRAAIYPEESSYWYFLSREDGETIFSRTLEEHNMNKRK